MNATHLPPIGVNSEVDRLAQLRWGLVRALAALESLPELWCGEDRLRLRSMLDDATTELDEARRRANEGHPCRALFVDHEEAA